MRFATLGYGILLAILTLSLNSWLTSGSLTSLFGIVFSLGFGVWIMSHSLNLLQMRVLASGFRLLHKDLEPVARAQSTLCEAASLQTDVLTERRREKSEL